MNSSSPKRLSNETVEAAYQEHLPALERFLLGVLKDSNAVSDALQITFIRLMEKGADVKPSALRSWLYRVAYNEAMLFHRKQKVDRKAKDSIAWQIGSQIDEENEGLRTLEMEERAERVREALQRLPEAQQEIVELRIREGLKFAEIASRLKLPLGTVLTRMRSGLNKLREYLQD